MKTNEEIAAEMLDLINIVEVAVNNGEELSSDTYYAIAERLDRALCCALTLGDRKYKEELN